MFEPGQILYFSEFQFKNGNTPKTKYFIVLARKENKTIVASLPTRTDRVPSFVNKDHGCINIDEHCYNCYRFAKDHPICENGFAFDQHCFIYGDQVEDYEMEDLASTYILNVSYIIIDVLTKAEYNAIIQCLLISNSVKRKIKKFLR